MSETTVQDVDAQIKDAEIGVNELEQRVIDGDDAVTADDVDKARGRLGFLRLQRKGAEKRQYEREEKERQDAYDEAMTEREAFHSEGIVPAQKAYANVVKAIAAFQHEYTTLRDAYAQIGETASNLGVPLPQDIRWLYDFSHHQDSDGTAFLKAAVKDASGEPIDKAHGLHSAEIQKAVQDRVDAANRAEEERQAQYMAQFTTRTESAEQR